MQNILKNRSVNEVKTRLYNLTKALKISQFAIFSYFFSHFSRWLINLNV